MHDGKTIKNKYKNKTEENNYLTKRNSFYLLEHAEEQLEQDLFVSLLSETQKS